ncbi:MAG: cell wall-binding repeat-containing protein [bacterium]|nr:cell wall-binding repeat-containing protein [bacterium]
MQTSRFYAHIFLIALVVSTALVLSFVAKREQPTPAQLFTGGPKTFTEGFSSTAYRDINYSTAQWDTAAGTLSVPSNRTTALAQSLTVDTVSDPIEAATLTSTILVNNGLVRFYLSNDAGQTYMPVVPGHEHLFTTTGDRLKWKVELEKDSAGISPVLDDLTITYRSSVPDHIVQLNAADAVHLGIEVSRTLFPDAGGASAVILGRDDDVIDTFVATPLARSKNAALLFTGTDLLHPDTAAEIARALDSTSKQIIILGEQRALSAVIETQLGQLGFTNLTRIGGATRYETAALIANELISGNPGPARHAYLTEALFLADAYSAAAPASSLADTVVEPILLLERGKSSPHRASLNVLRGHPEIVSATAVGGPQSIPEGALQRLNQELPSLALSREAGSDRFGTNDIVVNAHFSEPAVIALTNGQPNGNSSANVYAPLLASLLAAFSDGPLLFVQPGTIPPAQVKYLYDQAPSIRKAYVVGDITGEHPEVLEQLLNLISRP